MATTIINPAPSNNISNNNAMEFLVGGLVLAVFVVLFFLYAFPYIRTLSGSGGIQINVPKSINVNVQQSK